MTELQEIIGYPRSSELDTVPANHASSRCEELVQIASRMLEACGSVVLTKGAS